MSQRRQAMCQAGWGAIVLLTLVAGVQAQTAAPSREAVRKEAVQANKAGDIEHHGDAASAPSPGKKVAVDKKTAASQRTEVRKEAVTAQKAGAVSRGEADPMPKSGTRVSSSASREKVRKEATQANKTGDIEHHGDTPASPPAPANKRSEPAKAP